jgi:wobble nucleotide-excising tRNase
MIPVEEAEHIRPICPFCEKEITKVYAKRMETFFGVKFLYFCSLCKKILGVTHRKGFWMG